MTLKMAVLAPIPIASVIAATMANPRKLPQISRCVAQILRQRLHKLALLFNYGLNSI
jgi:hypothetical protein